MLSSCSRWRGFAFEVYHLDDQIFRFSVCSKQVGLMVLRLNSFVCEWFKLGFFLLNDSSFKKALVFAKLDSGPSFSWESSRSKGVAKKSFAQIASARNHPLTGANCTPLGPQKSSRSVFDRLQFPRFSTGCNFPAGQFLIDLDLQILQNNLNQAAGKRPHRFLGQAAHPLRSPILLQVLAIMGKGLQLPTTCRTQGQTLLFAGTVIKEAT
jgi:hypothetical protein